MSEKLKRLQLNPPFYGSTTLGHGEHWRRDIQDIFTPSTSKILKFFERDAFGMLTINARAKGARPAYSVSTHRRHDEQTAITNNSLVSEPGQAAAWAVLRMYLEHPSNANHPAHVLNEIQAVDYNKDSAAIFDDLEHFRDQEGAAFKSELWMPAATLIHVETLGYTVVRARNENDRNLPEMLVGIKHLYDEMYPSDLYPDAHTSAAVAGMVGAHDVESLSATWNEIRDNESSPVIAARLLLHSGIFSPGGPQN